MEYESYLDDTDYTVIKIYEAMIVDPDSVEALKDEYQSIIEQRAQCRTAINELMESLKNGNH